MTLEDVLQWLWRTCKDHGFTSFKAGDSPKPIIREHVENGVHIHKPSTVHIRFEEFKTYVTDSKLIEEAIARKWCNRYIQLKSKGVFYLPAGMTPPITARVEMLEIFSDMLPGTSGVLPVRRANALEDYFYSAAFLQEAIGAALRCEPYSPEGKSESHFVITGATKLLRGLDAERPNGSLGTSYAVARNEARFVGLTDEIEWLYNALKALLCTANTVWDTAQYTRCKELSGFTEALDLLVQRYRDLQNGRGDKAIAATTNPETKYTATIETNKPAKVRESGGNESVRKYSGKKRGAKPKTKSRWSELERKVWDEVQHSKQRSHNRKLQYRDIDEVVSKWIVEDCESYDESSKEWEATVIHQTGSKTATIYYRLTRRRGGRPKTKKSVDSDPT